MWLYLEKGPFRRHFISDEVIRVGYESDMIRKAKMLEISLCMCLQERPCEDTERRQI